MADVTSSDGHCGTRLHTAWASVLIWTDLTGARTVLRNGVTIGSIPAGGIVYYDHYPPLGANASYQVSNGSTTSTTAVQPIPADAQHRTWLKSAVNPNLSLAVSTAIGPLPEVAQTQELGVFKIRGASAPFVIFGDFSTRQTTIQVRARSAAQRDGVLALLAAEAPFYYQPDALAQEGPMWCAATGVKRDMVPGGPNPWWEMSIPVMEVAAPSLTGTIIPGWGWDNVKATWATSNALRSANATGLALIQYGVS